MEKQVNLEFSGVSNVNPDNISKNGEVAMGFGLTSQSTISTPTSPKKVHFYHIDNCDVVCIHKGSGFENVFVYDKENDQVRAYHYDELANEDGEPTAIASVDGKPTSACMLGNVVVLTFSDKQKYFYREGDEYTYERDSNLPTFHMEIVAAVRRAFYYNEDGYLGDKVSTNGPDGIAITQSSERGIVSKQSENHGLGNIPVLGGDTVETTPNAQQEYHMGCFNKLVNDWAGRGYLLSPVLIRACYRLKSGNVASLTPPVLCMPFTTPLIATELAFSSVELVQRTRGIAYKLYAKFLGIEDDDFSKYEDIISSVEIFMSLPIYTYSTEALDVRRTKGYEYIKDVAGFGDILFTPFKIWGSENNGEGNTPRIKVVYPGEKNEALSCDELERTMTFFKVCSIPFKKDKLVDITDETVANYYENEIYDTFTDGALRGYRKLIGRTNGKDIPVTSEYLAAQEPLEEVLYSGSAISDYPLRSVVYNQRLLNLGRTFLIRNEGWADVSTFTGMVRMKSLCSFTEINSNETYSPTVQYDITKVPSIPMRTGLHSIYIVGYGVIKDTEGSKAAITIRLGAMRSIPMYLAFQQVNLKYILAQGSYFNGARPKDTYAKIYFEEHPTLNLAYFKGEVEEYTNESDGYAAVKAEYEALEKAVAEGTATYTTDNYIRASNVGDPYTFEDSNTAYFNTTVKEVMVVPEAISLGQYGTAQLYVLCEDGIYTVAVSNEGKLQSVTTYSQERPVHPERSCVFKTQLVTNNGREWGAYSGQRKEDLLSLMRNLAFAFDELPHISDKIVSGDYSTLVQGTTLYDFLCNASLAYDGHNDQLVAYAEGYPCIAVWKQGHGLHILPIPATRKVEASRLVLADAEQNIYEFAEADILEDTEGLLVSRPIHLADDINTPCTVRKLIVRGDFDYQRAQIKLVLYGTRDFRKWHLVASSATYYLTGISGSGYKAFKVAVIAKLGRHEYISHLTIRYVEKPTKNLSF